MNLNYWTCITFMIIINLIFYNWVEGTKVSADNDVYYTYEEAFVSAVSDTGEYLGELEAQQLESSVHYSKEKKLAVDMDVVTSFYANLALRFGGFDDPSMVQDIMMHTPAMAVVNYDNLQIISPKFDGSGVTPVIGEERPFTLKLDSGNLLYFTLDDNVVIYEVLGNRYIESNIKDLLAYSNLSPITNLETFETIKQNTIAETLQESIEVAIRDFNNELGQYGFSVRFGLPLEIGETRFSNIGFFAFIQGYPLPGGELLTSFSFGSSSVSRGNEYYGVIRSDGRHVAYETACGVPTNTFLIEILYGEKEAARKGYFVEACPY